MGFSNYCSLNSVPPPSASPISRTPEVACPQSPRSGEGSLRKQCLLGLTCAIIGLQLGDFAVMAGDMQSGPSRWSEKRACKPWRVNSLETIVPENLPRPSTRRRWEDTGFAKAAPPLKVVAKSGAKGCFNL